MNNEMPSSAFNRVNGGGGSSSLWTPSSAPSVHTPFILAPPPAGTASSAGTHGSNNNNNNNSTTNGTSTGSPMKVPVKPPPLKSLPPLSGYGGGSSVPLSPSGLANMADRLPHLTLPFSPDMLWRYPTQFSALTASSPVSAANQHSHHSHHPHQQQPPSSPHLDVKTHLPGALGPDPRTWAREDVVTFLRWCEREFDLPGLDLDKFQMNGKALCLLNKADIAERAPGSGDVVHNALQLLLRDAPYTGRVPSSPLTPHPHTAHQQHLLSHALAAAAAHQQQQLNNSSSGSSSGSGNGGGSHLLSPPNSARTPTSASWPSAAGPLFASADFHSLGHLIQQTNSVTLSPAPSVSDGSGNSQGGSPSHAEQSAAAAAAAAALAAQAHINFYTQALAQAHNQAQAVAASNAQHHAGGGAGSNSGSQSDSEENDSAQDSPSRSPAPSTPIHLAPPPMSPLATTFSIKLEKDSLSTTPSSDRNGGSASNGGGGDGLDSGSNGRLLWDFLQQLLNDPSQRYSHYIAWKNRETGVFKITDPAGLARLWGIQKNHPSMNYDKMSRALRYYYRVNILRKVQGERHCYQFLRNPIELKSIKNISLLRHQMAAAAAAAATTTTSSSSSTSSTTSTATLGSSGKMADSTDASSERYSPSSSCNAMPDQDYGLHNNNNNNNNNNIEQQETEDCDMPTDLSMDNCERRGHTNPTSSSATNSYLPPPIKTENMAS